MNMGAGGGGRGGYLGPGAMHNIQQGAGAQQFAMNRLRQAQQRGQLPASFKIGAGNNAVGQFHALSGALAGHGNIGQILQQLRAGTQQGHGAGQNFLSVLGGPQPAPAALPGVQPGGPNAGAPALVPPALLQQLQDTLKDQGHAAGGGLGGAPAGLPQITHGPIDSGHLIPNRNNMGVPPLSPQQQNYMIQLLQQHMASQQAGGGAGGVY